MTVIKKNNEYKLFSEDITKRIKKLREKLNKTVKKDMLGMSLKPAKKEN
jgi:hypothetical protein